MPIRRLGENKRYLVCINYRDKAHMAKSLALAKSVHLTTTMRRETGLSPTLYTYCCEVCSYVELYFEGKDEFLHERK